MNSLKKMNALMISYRKSGFCEGIILNGYGKPFLILIFYYIWYNYNVRKSIKNFAICKSDKLL